jgi:PPK2 family polyphosphate:nucleotide phosphotransferase
MADNDRLQDDGSTHVRQQLKQLRVTSGNDFALKHYSTRCDIPGLGNKGLTEAALESGKRQLSKLQEQLYARSSWSLLIVLQAMDAGGKDSTIKHVMSGVNPQGVSVTPFKPPSHQELAHNFLWRVSKVLPARGMIGIFNRSHYEEVLVPRVEPDLLERQGLPVGLTTGKHFWDDRLEDIAAFELHLARQGTCILKFFLNISHQEQRKRFLARLDDPAKLWKFSLADLADSARWDAYMQAYEAAITVTASKQAPWYIIPADDKPIARVLVVHAIVEALEALDLKPLDPTPEQEVSLAEARRRLEQ